MNHYFYKTGAISLPKSIITSLLISNYKVQQFRLLLE